MWQNYLLLSILLYNCRASSCEGLILSNYETLFQSVAGTENWQRVNTEIPVKSPRFALFDLAEGKSYQFRVRCCNSAGIGEPSEATEATVVGDKLGKCIAWCSSSAVALILLNLLFLLNVSTLLVE